jgi:hypothetical protein
MNARLWLALVALTAAPVSCGGQIASTGDAAMTDGRALGAREASGGSSSGGVSGAGGSGSGGGSGGSSSGASGSSGSSSSGAGGSSGVAGSCPAPSQVVAGSSCSLNPSVPCDGVPLPDCDGTTTPTCTCQSGHWQCVTSFPACEGGPCPNPSQVVTGSSCALDPSISCSGEPVPDCQGTTTPSCTCQSHAWACVTSYPYCDGG